MRSQSKTTEADRIGILANDVTFGKQHPDRSEKRRAKSVDSP